MRRSSKNSVYRADINFTKKATRTTRDIVVDDDHRCEPPRWQRDDDPPIIEIGTICLDLLAASHCHFVCLVSVDSLKFYVHVVLPCCDVKQTTMDSDPRTAVH